MPKLTSALAVAAISLCLLAAGCSPPVVSVHHKLPAALPLPADITSLRVGEFTVAELPAAPAVSAAEAPAGPAAVAVTVTPELASLMTDRLGRELTETLPAATDGAGIVGGSLHVSIGDTRGVRTVLRFDPATKGATPVEVATLVRTARLRVDFAVSRAADGQGLGIAEVVRTYDSAADPSVRGELGLERPDDPNRVPPVETIIKGLLAQCAHAFKRMVTPTPADAEIPLRSAGGAAARQAFAAARKGDWPQAVAAFRKALAADPENPALNFDLAAAAEAADQLDLAARYYEHALKLSDEKDIESQDAARRCRRVLQARKQPATTAAGKGS